MFVSCFFCIFALDMKYFTIDELCHSSTAKRMGIDNKPNNAVVCNLSRLVREVLDPLREEYGRPIIVTSGYRSPKLNKLVGGTKYSAHLDGRAVDILSAGFVRELTKKIGDIIVNHINDWPIDQVIFENRDNRGLPAWIHVSFSRSPRRMIINS